MPVLTDPQVAELLAEAAAQGLPPATITQTDTVVTFHVADAAAVRAWAEHLELAPVEHDGRTIVEYRSDGYTARVVDTPNTEQEQQR